MAQIKAKWITKDSQSLEDASGALQVKVTGAVERTVSGLNVADLGVTNAMLAGSIEDGKLNQITAGDKVAGSAVQLSAVPGLQDDTGLEVLPDATRGVQVTASGVGVADSGISNAMLAGSISDDKLNQITTADKVAGSAIELADTSLEDVSGGPDGLRVKIESGGGLETVAGGVGVADLGVTNAMLAGSIEDSKLNTITTADKVSGSAVQLGDTSIVDSTGLIVNIETGGGLETVAGGVGVADLGVTNAMLAGSIEDSKLNTITTANKVSGSAVQLASTDATLEDSTGLQVRFGGSSGLERNADGLAITAGGVTDAMLAGSISDGNLAESYIKADGTRAFTGDQSMGSNKLTNLSNGTADNDAVNLSQLNAVATQGKLWKEVLFTDNQNVDGVSGGLYAAQVFTLSAQPTTGQTVVLNDGISTETFTWDTDMSIGADINASLDNLSTVINGGAIAVSATSTSMESIDATNNTLIVWQDTIGEATRIYGTTANGKIADPTMDNLYEALAADMVALPGSDPAATNFGFSRAKASLAANETHMVRDTDSSWTWDTDDEVWNQTGATSIPYASKTVYGKVKIGDGINVSAGLISVDADGTGGANLSRSINVNANGISVMVDDSSIGENGSQQLYVKADGITETEIVSTAIGNGLTGGSGTVISVNVGNGLTNDEGGTGKLGLTTLTSDWDIGGTNTITNVPSPTNASDVVNKDYVDNLNSLQVETYTLTGTDITNKYVTLSAAPTTAADVLLFIKEAPNQFYGDDYQMDATNTDRLTWGGLDLDGILAAGDKFSVQYST